MVIKIEAYKKAMGSVSPVHNPIEQMFEEKNRILLKDYLVGNLNELGYKVYVLDSDILGNNSNIMRLERLRKEVEGLKMKLNKAIPVPAIFLMCLSLTVSAVFATIMITYYVTGIELIPLPTACMILISALALFATSIYTIFDWRKWLNEEAEQTRN